MDGDKERWGSNDDGQAESNTGGDKVGLAMGFRHTMSIAFE